MRTAEYKQISTKKEQRTVLHAAVLDEEGDVLTEPYEETVTVDVPVMGVV